MCMCSTHHYTDGTQTEITPLAIYYTTEPWQQETEPLPQGHLPSGACETTEANNVGQVETRQTFFPLEITCLVTV